METGASMASSDTKNNWLSHEQVNEWENETSRILGEISKEEGQQQLTPLAAEYYKLSASQNTLEFLNANKDADGYCWTACFYTNDSIRVGGILRLNSDSDTRDIDTTDYALNSYLAEHRTTLSDLGLNKTGLDDLTKEAVPAALANGAAGAGTLPFDLAAYYTGQIGETMPNGFGFVRNACGTAGLFVQSLSIYNDCVTRNGWNAVSAIGIDSTCMGLGYVGGAVIGLHTKNPVYGIGWGVGAGIVLDIEAKSLKNIYAPETHPTGRN